MEQPSSSSKVTVEYFDPHGVYQLLSPGLLPRLPLRNLHWESHAGPLRSISSLHVDLIPSAQESRPLSSTGTPTTSSSNLNLSRVKSEDSAVSSDDGFRPQPLGQTVVDKPELGAESGPKPVVKERRHQIPGLRQTPYLKIFFLRCDDNETYKAQARRQVREWIKEHTPPTQSTGKQSKQDNHDAYEWLIVHVVVPNTAAATQPRASGKGSEGGSGSVSEKAPGRWRGGGSTTILEKLRADFNGSSKSAPDRIAQIRIGVNDVPYEMLPRVVPAIPGSYTETAHDNENAWQDLISKLKSLILASFDLRVSQYEEDIREKDAQRSLPGWNFCTFFVLKEGLARGFESVGLVEDALVGYDELAVGLDTIITEQAIAGPGPQHGGSFLPYTEDLKIQAQRAKAAILKDTGGEDVSNEADEHIDLQSSSKPIDHDAEEITVDALKKRYRELILANNISIFDFRCYIFARQLSLLLRLANAWSSQEELLAKLKEQRESNLQGVAARLPHSQPSEDGEHLAMLAEICRRSMDFVVAIARVLRDDIWASQPQAKLPAGAEDEKSNSKAGLDPIMVQVVDSMASSFTFSVAQQILAQTATKALPIPPSTLAPPGAKIGLDGQEPKSAIPEPKTMMHPARSSSLAIRSPPREGSSVVVFPRVRRSSVPEQGASSTFIKAGLEELAAHRAELYLLSRTVLEREGMERGWSAGWDKIPQVGHKEEMEDVDLSEEPASTQKPVVPSAARPTLHGIKNTLLRTALDNEDDFYRLYETLTDKALRHYTVAGHTQSVSACMADLAVHKDHLKDYAAAASYFYRIQESYGEDGWAETELSMLVMYARCLKELQRKEEYVNIVLKLLSKVAASEKDRRRRKSCLRLGGHPSFDSEEPISTTSYLHDLLDITKSLGREIQVPLQNFFSRIVVDGTPRYHAGKDSFAIQLRFQYLLSDDLPVERAKVRINALTGDTSREVWLETSGPPVFKNGSGTLVVQSNVIVPGPYTVSHVSLYTNNIALEYEHGTAPSIPFKEEVFFKCPKLLIYHRPEAFDVRLVASKHMHLDHSRSLELELAPGWNEVASGVLHIRAATAGLRLQTAEAKVVDGSLELSKKSEAGVIRFGSLASGSTTTIRMPFTLEHEANDISLKLELSYTTDKGQFSFATTPSVSIILPLGVNVHDVFKLKALFSKFTISSATSSPLRLLSSRLEGSEVFEAQSGVALTHPLMVFPRQPASMLYRITKQTPTIPLPRPGARKGQKSTSLSLVLHYICLEEEIDDAITKSLNATLQDSPLHQYSRLIIPTVITELRSRLSPHDLEKIAILSEVSTSVLSGIRWRERFLGLGQEEDQDIATMLAESLQTWQEKASSIALVPITIDEDTVADHRSIIIPVGIPAVTVVHSADLKLTGITSILSNTVVAASNQPISASLKIKWTRQWDEEHGPDDIQGKDLEFYYEVSGATDTWLIGGKRKGHFTVPKNTGDGDNARRLSFPVVLIPLREGMLPFPNVDIRPAPLPRANKPGDNEDSTRGNITCETDYKNAGETIRVINDARKVTVSLDASGPQGGAMLLETEARGTMDAEAAAS